MSVIKPSRCRYKLMRYKLHWKPHSNSKYFQARVLTSAQATFAFNLFFFLPKMRLPCSKTVQGDTADLCLSFTSAGMSECGSFSCCLRKQKWLVRVKHWTDAPFALSDLIIWSKSKNHLLLSVVVFFCLRAEELNPQLSNGRKKQINPKAVEDFTVESMKQLGPLSSLSFFRSRFICEVMSGCNSRVPKHTHDSFRLWVFHFYFLSSLSI